MGASNIVIDIKPIKGHIVAGIGFTPDEVIGRSYLSDQDIESSFRVFRGSPDFNQGVSFDFVHEKYAFSIPYALFVSVTSLNEYGEAPFYGSYKDLTVHGLGIRKLPIYSDFDGAYEEVINWEKFFLGLGFRRTKIKREDTYEEAKEMAVIKIKGNEFPTFYVSSGRTEELAYAIGVDRSVNQLGTSKYGYNVNISIARYPNNKSFWE